MSASLSWCHCRLQAHKLTTNSLHIDKWQTQQLIPVECHSLLEWLSLSWMHLRLSSVWLPLCYLRSVQKSAVFSCQGSCVRVESVAPSYSVPLHNLCCYNWRGVISWSLYGRCKLARAASRLTVPPRPSHAPFPCEVAEKCHSALTLKSSLFWHKFRKFFLFLYCDATPSEK